MSRRHNNWVDATVWDTVNTQRDDVQRLGNEVFEQRRSLNQERSEREQETARLRQELEEVKKQIKCLTTFMANQGQIFVAFTEIESKKNE